MLVDAMYGSPSTEGSMALVKEDLRVEMNTHMQMILQQLKNEQAASTIQMSQFNAVQHQQMSDELHKATLFFCTSGGAVGAGCAQVTLVE